MGRLRFKHEEQSDNTTPNLSLIKSFQSNKNAQNEYSKMIENKRQFLKNQGINTSKMSDVDIQREYSFRTQPKKEISKAPERTEKEHQLRHKSAVKELENSQKLKGIKEEVLPTIDALVGWIPVMGDAINAGASEELKNLGDKEAALERGILGTTGMALNLIGIPYLFSKKGAASLLSSYLGSGIAGAISNNNPEARLAGALVGGVTPDIAGNFVQNAKQALKNYKLGTELYRSIESTPIYHMNVYHSVPESQMWTGQPLIWSKTNALHHVGDYTTANNVAKSIEQNGEKAIIKSGDLRYTTNSIVYRNPNNTDPGVWMPEIDKGLNYSDNFYSIINNPNLEGTLKFGDDADIIAYKNLYEGKGKTSYGITNPNTILYNDNIIFMKNPITNGFIENGRDVTTGKAVQELKMDGFNDIRLIVNDFQYDPNSNKFIYNIPGKARVKGTVLDNGNIQIYEYTQDGSDLISKGVFTKDELLTKLKEEQNSILSESNTFKKYNYLEADKIPEYTGNSLSTDTSNLNQNLIEKIKQSIQDDIDLIYKSPEYEEKFLNSGFTSKQYNQFLKEIQQLKDEAVATYFKNSNNPNIFGLSNTKNLTYGYNVSIIKNEIEDFIKSVIFHEFGHVQNRASEIINNEFIEELLQNVQYNKYPMLNEIRKYNEKLIDTYRMPGLKEDVLPKLRSKEIDPDYFNYAIGDSEELMQRLRQGMKGQIENGISNEDVLEAYNLTGIKETDLPKFFKSDALKNMTIKILSATPLLIGSNYVFNNRNQSESN